MGNEGNINIYYDRLSLRTTSCQWAIFLGEIRGYKNQFTQVKSFSNPTNCQSI